MPSSLLRNITVDSDDPYAQATWWAQVVGGSVPATDAPGDDEVAVALPADRGGPGLLFIRVPEAKSVKNRIHLDLTPETSRDEEVARLQAVGARVVERHVDGESRGWVVMADPEGNEFCIERSDAERAGPR
jgi:predicted enzyme related to lactoylglutathione lyase